MATPESVPKVGIKLPPYTYSTQFENVASALREFKSSEPGEGSVIDFLACTNTLGSSLVLKDDNTTPALNSEAGTGIGGYVSIPYSCFFFFSHSYLPYRSCLEKSRGGDNESLVLREWARILTVLRLAGAALHPLALGNVATFRRLLDQSDDTKNILIIGIGGVSDAAGVKRMQAVGAGAVGLASSLGTHGVKIFELISGKA